MTYDEYSGSIALTEQDESFFIFRMLVVEELTGVLIIENGFGFRERDAVFPEVRTSFGLAPFELNHTYIVCIFDKVSRRALTPETVAP